MPYMWLAMTEKEAELAGKDVDIQLLLSENLL